MSPHRSNSVLRTRCCVVFLCFAFVFMPQVVDAASGSTNFGKICQTSADCGNGASCVAGNSDIAIQRCVADPPCSGGAIGNCPADEVNGQLSCIWRPAEGKECTGSKRDGCGDIDGKLGINKCISISRCDEYTNGTCSSMLHLSLS